MSLSLKKRETYLEILRKIDKVSRKKKVES